MREYVRICYTIQSHMHALNSLTAQHKHLVVYSHEQKNCAHFVYDIHTQTHTHTYSPVAIASTHSTTLFAHLLS